MNISPPFYLLVDQNLYNSYVYDIEDEVTVDLEIYFNTDSPEGRSFTASGFIEFTYVDHPQVDKIPLKGEINYPNIRFQPDIVDFRCLPLGCYNTVNVELQNISPLIVWYKFEWADISQIIYLPPNKIETPSPKPVPSITSTKTSGYSESQVILLPLPDEQNQKDITKGRSTLLNSYT